MHDYGSPMHCPQLVIIFSHTRDSIYAIARICHANFVCLSCLSVTRVYCIKTAECIIKILSLSDRNTRCLVLVFSHRGSLRKPDGFTPNGGAKYKGVAILYQYAAISRKRL